MIEKKSRSLFQLQSRYLYLEKVTKEDRGLYRCLADNNVRPPSYFDVKLYVYYSPVAKNVQSSYGQAENRMFDVTIECTVAGKKDSLRNLDILP